MDAGPQRTAAHHEQIGLAIVIEIEPEAAGAGAFEQRSQLFGAKRMREGNAGLRRSIVKTDGASGGWLGQRQAGRQAKNRNE